VWLRDRSAPAEFLRIGRYAVERWNNIDGSLTLAAAYALPQDGAPEPQRLVEAIRVLYPRSFGTSSPSVALVLESAWLPVMRVDLGAAWLRAAQIDTLVRHRFGLQYSDIGDSVALWELRIDHRAGTPTALAYGMAPRLKQTLHDAASAAGLRWLAMTPAFAWGLERLRPAQAWPRATGWFAWPEQDRTLLAIIVASEVVGLNPGAQPAGDSRGLIAQVDADSVRFGIEASASPITAANWGSPPRTSVVDDRTIWLNVCGAARNAAAARSPMAGETTTTRTPA
jgi:hypothetical protein